MKALARLLEALALTPSRNTKLTLLTEFFRSQPDPDRGWALAALAGSLDLRNATASGLRALVEQRVDPVLFRLSYDYVGDLAETIALIWPSRTVAADAGIPDLTEVVEILDAASRSEAIRAIEGWLDRLEPSARLALIKLATGGLRVGVSERMAKTALAAMRDDDPATLDRIEQLWHGLAPPYTELFVWLDGESGPPTVDLTHAFRPMMLAHPLDNALFSADERKAGLHESEDGDALGLARLTERLDPDAFRAEWKWDGIRIQAVSLGGERRLYTRAGEEIGGSFPDVLERMAFEGVVDGELLIAREGEIAPFAELQRRLGRKKPAARLMRDSPGFLRLYDLLHDGQSDTRALAFDSRRARLESWFAAQPVAAGEGVDLSGTIAFSGWEQLARIRAGARDAGQEGLMLKRGDAPYLAGRPTGPWWKWKRAPLSADCVLMYAQRGHGKRSSFYSDYTFGAWRDGPDGPELTPVGKAYSGYTDEELKRLDKWVRDHTTDRYGPVRAVEIGLVFEVGFDAVQRSSRHKSGIAMRFPRIRRIRWDKPAREADRLETLEEMIRE